MSPTNEGSERHLRGSFRVRQYPRKRFVLLELMESRFNSKRNRSPLTYPCLFSLINGQNVVTLPTVCSRSYIPIRPRPAGCAFGDNTHAPPSVGRQQQAFRVVGACVRGGGCTGPSSPAHCCFPRGEGQGRPGPSALRSNTSGSRCTVHTTSVATSSSYYTFKYS
jgi:hypothetical protein